MARALVVKFPFAAFSIGDIIAAPDDVIKYFASHHPHVTPVELPDDHHAVVAAAPVVEVAASADAPAAAHSAE